MINNLKDFKASSKKLQSILQTYEIKTPEAFRLSNSASLNFMARILGYENYNTIKPVLDKGYLKEKSMFIEIKKHQGITVINQDEPIWTEKFENCLIGLHQIYNVEFLSENNDKSIHFSFSSDGKEWIRYKFSKDGMGEYNRIKRILDELTKK